MAVEFKYNKTSLQELKIQLKVRESALPTLKNKEAALRMEVRKSKKEAEAFQQKLDNRTEEVKSMVRLWAEFDADLMKLADAEYETKVIAGVRIPVLNKMDFEITDFSLFGRPGWFMDGIIILKELTRLSLQRDVSLRTSELLEKARKKTSQKVNLYEKVQIPDYKAAMSKIKRYLEDEENLSKSAQKILKKRTEQQAEI